MLALLVLSMIYWISDVSTRKSISYGYFLEQLQAGNVRDARINGLEVIGHFVTPPTIPPTMAAPGS